MPGLDKAKKVFDDYSKMLSPPFAMYSDIEAILEKADNNTDKILQTHVPCAVGSYLVPHKSLTYRSTEVVFHEGADCIEKYCDYLEEKAKEIYEYNKTHCHKKQDRTNPEHKRKFAAATSCEYCKVQFSEQTP